MNRPKYETKKLYLVAIMQRDTAIEVIKNAPIDPAEPLEVIIRERTKTRLNEQNALMWAGALKDISTQAWVAGKQFSAEVWHEHFKREYLPEEYKEGITKDGYKKWDYLPNGDRVLVGSTTQLLTRGFSDYLEQIYAFGAGLGIKFSAIERY